MGLIVFHFKYIFLCLILFFSVNTFPITKNNSGRFILEYFSECREEDDHKLPVDECSTNFYLSVPKGEKAGKRLFINARDIDVDVVFNKAILVNSYFLQEKVIGFFDNKNENIWELFLNSVLDDEEVVWGESYQLIDQARNTDYHQLKGVIYELNEKSECSNVFIVRYSLIFNLCKIKTMLLAFGGGLKDEVVDWLLTYLTGSFLNPLIIEEYAETFYHQLLLWGDGLEMRSFDFFHDKRKNTEELWNSIDTILNKIDPYFQQRSKERAAGCYRFFREYKQVFFGKRVSLSTAIESDPIGVQMLKKKELPSTLLEQDCAESTHIGSLNIDDSVNGLSSYSNLENRFSVAENNLQKVLKNKVVFWELEKRKKENQAAHIEFFLKLILPVSERERRLDVGSLVSGVNLQYSSFVEGEKKSIPVKDKESSDKNSKAGLIDGLKSFFENDWVNSEDWIDSSTLPRSLQEVCPKKILRTKSFLGKFSKPKFDSDNNRKKITDILKGIWSKSSGNADKADKVSDFFTQLYERLGNKKSLQLYDYLLKK